jgi:hypothetical protein
MKKLIGLLCGMSALAGAVLWATGTLGSTSATAGTQSPIISNIPVLVYHELNNGCAATTAVCNATDPESVSTAQMTAELSWMHAQGYQTINLTQYLDWLKGNTAGLPAKPLLLTFDNGIGNLLQGAVPVLQSFHYSAVAFLVSGFAYGAVGVCHGTPIANQPAINTQPGCPVDNYGWDLTWAQLRALPTSVYQFSLEAGPSGHFVQTYNPNCYQFYACMAPGETVAQYQARVQADQNTGISEIKGHLKNVDVNAWVVPYSDLGYSRCAQSDCTPQNSNGPAGWLQSEAAGKFRAAFVEDASQNGVMNQRFRFDVNGWMTRAEFQSMLNADIAAGSFNG